MPTHQKQHSDQSTEAAQKQSKAKSAQPGPMALAPQPSPLALQRAITDPRAASPRDILTLQRLAGNQAVTRLIQAKLTVGPAGDKYEQEADRVADQVVSGQPQANSGQLSAVSRQAEEEEEVQTKPLAASITPLVQRQAEDEEEVQTKPLVQRQAEDEEEVQTKPLVQRQAEDEEEVQTKSNLQSPISNPQVGFEAGPDVESRLATNKGGGSPLPGEVRAAMEPRFGADFGGVRVHTGGEADDLNRQLSAQAFTHGQDIYMAAGKYAPGTTAGNRLLAHELTHTIQQTGMQAARNIARAAETVQRNGDPPKSLTEHPLLEQARHGHDEQPDEVQLDATVPPVAAAILQPVLHGRDRFDIESDSSSIIRPIYASYWAYAGAHWQYVAGTTVSNAAPVLAGTLNRGMCQTFSNVFVELFNILNRALGAHFFDVSVDESLALTRFYTDPGLTLIGNTGCRGNIYLETQDGGQIVAMGYANINRYFYTYHWRPVINGITFDPLFNNDPATIHTTPVTAVPGTLYTYTDGTKLLCVITGVQQPSFGSNYVMINNKAAFEAKRQAVIDLYNLINAGWRERKRATGKWFPASEINRRCRALLATLGDLTVFEMASGCYNDGYVAGHQRFRPMLDEVRKRAQQ